MRTRRLGAGLIALALTTAMAACGSDDSKEGGSLDADSGACKTITDGSAKGEDLTVWIMEGTNPDATDYFKGVSAEFTKQTGAKLDVQFVPWADAKGKFDKSIVGDQTPDVAEVGSTWTGEFAEDGALVDLSECVDEAGLEDDLVPGLVEAATTTAGGDEEGMYGMPWYAGIRSVVYRTDVFDELKIEPPTSWDEFVAAGEKIKTGKPDMIPFPVPGSSEFGLYPWVWGAGGDVATEDDGEWKSTIDSDEAQEGIDFYTGLATEHDFSTAAASTWDEADVSDAFAKGDVAMAIAGSWTPNALVEANPDLKGKIGAFPIPGKDGGVAPSFLGGSHMGMFTTAEDQPLAWSFIQLMTTGKFAEQWSQESTYFPGQASLLEKLQSSSDPLVAPFAEQMSEGKSVPVTSKFADVQTQQTVPSMLLSILDGKASVADASKKAAEEMDTAFSDGS